MCKTIQIWYDGFVLVCVCVCVFVRCECEVQCDLCCLYGVLFGLAKRKKEERKKKK